MPIFHSKKVLFLHNPKTGGSTVESMFSIKMSPEYFYNDGRNYLQGNNCALQHLSYEALKKKLAPEIFHSYYKFTFVRNPWDRLVSTYLLE